MGQAAYQGVAVDQARAAPVHQKIFPVTQHQPRHIPKGDGMSQRVQKVAQLGPRSDAHAPQRGLVQRGFEIVQARAQGACVKRRGADRSAAGGGIRGVAMKVGDGVAVDELQCGVLAKKLDHARAVAQKRERARFVKMRAQFAAQVGQGFFDALQKARFDRQGIARNPHPAARPGGGATKLRVFLDHDDFQTQMRSGDGCRQTARARADDQKIAIPMRGRCQSHGVSMQGHTA